MFNKYANSKNQKKSLADGYSDRNLNCGTIDGVFPTVDFGITSDQNTVNKHFETQQNYSMGGPSVNSEFYTMWFTMWGEKTPVYVDIPGVLRTMDYMNKWNASFSFYMIHGGSNFGFWSGEENVGPVGFKGKNKT